MYGSMPAGIRRLLPRRGWLRLDCRLVAAGTELHRAGLLGPGCSLGFFPLRHLLRCSNLQLRLALLPAWSMLLLASSVMRWRWLRICRRPRKLRLTVSFASTCRSRKSGAPPCSWNPCLVRRSLCLPFGRSRPPRFTSCKLLCRLLLLLLLMIARWHRSRLPSRPCFDGIGLPRALPFDLDVSDWITPCSADPTISLAAATSRRVQACCMWLPLWMPVSAQESLLS